MISWALLLAAVFGGGRAYYHAPQIAPYQFTNTVVRLHFDLARKSVFGDETVTVRPKHAGLRALPFDSAGIHYTRVTVDGANANFATDDAHERIYVRLPRTASPGKSIAVQFVYRTKPRTGLFFVLPDKSYPRVTPEIWTQGEPEDNRHWFPTWDEPNEKTPSEVILTVPAGWTAVSNGYLKSHTVQRTGEVWDWDSPKPKSTYLISFAAGPLAKFHTTLGSLDVDSYVQPPQANLNAICFARTNQMIAYFQRRIGVPFPWEKYAQITAERYDFGGMEDASATLLSDRLLHPKSEEREDSCDIVISHELGQHWYGDSASMTGWANIWLHEGFATYLDELWSGERFGEAEFEYRRYEAQQAYFQETRQYLRPIVDPVYVDPLDLFDSSSHERPAAVLQMLRSLVGDDRFFGATRAYLQEYSYKNADTADFFDAVDGYLKTDLRWFENEWFYRSDYPHYIVSDRYDSSSRTLRLDVKQRNADGRPYRMPVAIEVDFSGVTRHVEALIDRNDMQVAVRGIASKPQMVLFDPDDEILKQLSFAQPVGSLAFQLARAVHVGDREWALTNLAEFAHGKSRGRYAAMHAVERAVLHDPFYGIRADAVAAAADFNDAASVDAALNDRDVRVRLAAENAAASLTKPPASVYTRLEDLSNDPDPDVAGAALTALGASRAPKAYDLLAGALGRHSFRETIASGAIAGLGAYGDSRALILIESRMVYGTQEDERNAAVGALATLAASFKAPGDAVPLLERLAASDPLISTRLAAISALGSFPSRQVLAVIQRIERSDPQILIRDTARAEDDSMRAALKMNHPPDP